MPKVCGDLQQVNTRSIQACWGLMGINVWNNFVRVEYPYIVSKSDKPLEMGNSCPRQENCMLPIVASNQSACFSFSTVNYSRKLHEKYSIRTAVCGVRQFHSLPHQIAECTWSCPTYPLWSTSLNFLLLCYCHIPRATHVPVGDDQLQHLELARNLARTFNSSYTPTFPEPQPLLGEGWASSDV